MTERAAPKEAMSEVMSEVAGLSASEAAFDPVAVFLRVLAHGEGLGLPRRASAGSVGYDLQAAVRSRLVLEAGKALAVPCGIALALPEVVEAQIRPRSGLALKHAVTCLNAPGTIDSDYRGEIKVILVNHGGEPFMVERGMRIAQIVFARVLPVRFVESETLEATARGSKGFGSSGERALADEKMR